MMCPNCNIDMVRDGSSTITGRKLADYTCPACGNTVYDVDEGTALWKVLDLDNQDMQKKD